MSFGDTIQEVHDIGVGPGLWSVDGKADLVHGSSLEASSGAHWGKQFVPALINQALLELRRLTDLPPQLLSLFQLGDNLDALHLAGLAEEELTLEATLQVLLDHLLNIPPVHELGQLDLSFVAEDKGFTSTYGRNLNSLDLLQHRARGALGHTSDLNNIGLLQLGEDRLDLAEFGGDLALADLPLREGVQHTLGGEPDNEVDLLGLRLCREVLKGERRHPGRRWEDARWEDRKWGVMDDLLDVGEHVNKLGIRLVLDAGRDTQGLSNFHGDWLPIDARDNPLQLSGMGKWSDSEEVVLESVWLDKSVDLGNKSRTFNLSWVPDGHLNLALGYLAFNLDWKGGMDGHFNTSTHKLLGEWGNDAIVGLELAIQDWENLAEKLWHQLALHWGDLHGSLDRVNDWQSGGGQDWEASFSSKHVGSIKDLVCSNVVELNIMSSLHLGGQSLKCFHNNLAVQVEGGFHTSPAAVDKAEWSGELPSLQLQFLCNLGQLLLDWRGSLLLTSEEVHVIFQDIVHAVGVGRELDGLDLVDVGWSIVHSLEGHLVGDQRLLGVHQLVLVADKNLQVVNKG